jgi:hypothetical protein
VDLPLSWCTVEDVVMGFFTGTEPDPVVPNSKCVTYFPTLQTQFGLITSQLNITLLVPTNTFRFLDTSATMVNKFALWQTYCTFGTLFTRLDNTIETLEGLTTAFYRVIMNYAKVLVKIGNFTTAFNAQKCFAMSQAVGEIFSLIFDFQVPEDVI